jgi:hypothetical protein
MTTYVMRNGRLIDKRLAGPMQIASSGGPNIISDIMAPLKHPGTGAVIDSKARFRQHTRAAGCVEVGTDPAAMRERPRHTVSEVEIVNEVRQAIAELRSR